MLPMKFSNKRGSSSEELIAPVLRTADAALRCFSLVEKLSPVGPDKGLTHPPPENSFDQEMTGDNCVLNHSEKKTVQRLGLFVISFAAEVS
jgi:hypothetical protein